MPVQLSKALAYALIGPRNLAVAKGHLYAVLTPRLILTKANVLATLAPRNLAVGKGAIHVVLAQPHPAATVSKSLVHVVVQGETQAPPSLFVSKAFVHVVLKDYVAPTRRRPQILICG
jgi:hypothetical protein